MKRIIRFLFLFIIPGTFVSCETDFNVIADYKEVAIVYGLLNQNDSIHYLRINKAFLGEGNALTYAQAPDSSSFGSDVTVLINEITPSGEIREITFDTVTLYTKQPGDFYSPGQLFYFSDAKLNQENTYELKITGKKTDLLVGSKTKLIHTFYFTKPISGNKYLNFQRTITTTKKFAWANAVNAKRYQFKLLFNYNELLNSGDTIHKKIEWIFPEVISDDVLTSDDGVIPESDISYVNEDFYVLCESKIPYSDPVKESNVVSRFASVVNLEVTAIGDEFNTYLDANGPSTGVLMEKPSYSNITNGLGLFSCRFQIQWDDTRPALRLSPETILDLNTTTNLKFAKPN